MLLDEPGDSLGLLVGHAESVGDFLGHPRADFVVIVESDTVFEGLCGWLSDIVQEGPEGECGGDVLGEFIEHEEGVYEDVAFGMKLGGLLDAFQGVNFRENVFEQSGITEQFETASCAAFGEDQYQLVVNALDACFGNCRCDLGDGAVGFIIDYEVEPCGESDGAEYSEVVFLESFLWFPDGANGTRCEVFLPANIVDNIVVLRIEEEGIDGEVTSARILLLVDEFDGGGVASVCVWAVFSEGRDFDVFVLGGYAYDAELGADGDAVGEYFHDLIGSCACGNVKVFGGCAEELIAYASACEEGAVSLLAKTVADGACFLFRASRHRWYRLCCRRLGALCWRFC